MDRKAVVKIAMWVLVCGGLILAVEGIFDKNVIAVVLGDSAYKSIVEVAIGLAALIVADDMIRGS